MRRIRVSSVEEQGQDAPRKLSPRTQSFVQRMFRDPRYLLIGKTERFGRELIAFVEGCTVISSTGDVRGQVLINSEYELRLRPDGERPYQHESLADYYLSQEAPLGEDDLSVLREESWQYYVRRNFAFLLEEFEQARNDAEHNLSIWNLFDQADAGEDAKWYYLRWWPWIERDRAIAQALLFLQQGQLQQVATELYRAQRSIEQYEQRHASRYAREEEDERSLCVQMKQHLSALTEILREDEKLPISMEGQLDQAAARGDTEEVERLRREMILQAMGDED
jgi:hypothetical protein